MQFDKEFKKFLHTDTGPVSEAIDWNDYRIGYFLMKKKSDGSKNEDTLFLLAQGEDIVFGVSDGAGGHPKGDEAAYIAGQTVMDFYSGHNVSEIRLIDVLEGINDKVMDLKAGAYCTLTLATIEKDILRSCSVGDSEIIYWNASSNEVYSNIPHSQVGYSIEAGHIDQKESLDDPERYIVDNLLGEKAFRIEASSKMELRKGHTILMGSDGLFDNLSHEQLKDVMSKGSFDKSFEELCQICTVQDEKTWKKEDDISFIVVRKIKA